MRRFGLILFFFFLTLGMRAQSALESYVRELFAEDSFASSVWGMEAVRMDGKVLARYNERQKMVPASNMKLVTTAAALTALGSDYAYQTIFATDSSVVDGVVLGNLYIVGHADPSTSEEVFPQWKAALDEIGLSEIRGSIIGDARYFKSDGCHEDWTAGDYESEDASPVKGLNFNHNYRDTTYAEGKGASGAFNCAYYFHKYLNDNGVCVCGTYGDNITFSNEILPQDSLHILTYHVSEPLETLVHHTNSKSDNFYAEALLRTLGAELKGDDSYEASIEEEKTILKSLGVNPSSGLTICDGSGLARRNYASPDFFVKFLALVADSEIGDDFISSLPVPGEGTLASMLISLPPQTRSRIRMKSGSMGAVRSFSGYVNPKPGESEDSRIVFSIITNNNTAPKGTVLKYLEKLISLIALEP